MGSPLPCSSLWNALGSTSTSAKFAPIWFLMRPHRVQYGVTRSLQYIECSHKKKWKGWVKYIYNPECHPLKKSGRNPLWVISLFIAWCSGWQKQQLTETLHSEVWILAWVLRGNVRVNQRGARTSRCNLCSYSGHWKYLYSWVLLMTKVWA